MATTDEEPIRVLVKPEALKTFLELNHESEILQTDEGWSVEKPWSDDTIVLTVKASDMALLQALNSVRLPPRFTAIWHQDTGDVEFIYGPIREEASIRRRSFDFTFKGQSYKCEFADASERLRKIALAARASGPPSDTDHRHLILIERFIRRYEQAAEPPKGRKYCLTSFWIRNAKPDEQRVLELARHLNFYMGYFDRRSPRIIIHTDPVTDEPLRQLAFPDPDKFPTKIVGAVLDPYLLGLWESGVTARDTVRLFLHNYQVLEYAAFYYLKEDLLTTIKRLIKAPDATDRADEICREAVELLAEDRMSDEDKMVSVIQRAVDPRKVWAYIAPHKEYFSESHDFDGGFIVAPLIKAGWGMEDFATAWIPKVPDSLRKIRNALVHAREKRVARSIAATPRNLRLLAPWADLLTAISNELVLYGPE